MVGTVKQQIYIPAIPKGMTLTITELNLLPPDPPKEWRATLYKNDRQLYAPFVFDPNVDGGHLGEVKLYGAHAFPTNSLGARLEILWVLSGTPTRTADGQVEMVVADKSAVHPAEASDAERAALRAQEVAARGESTEVTEPEPKVNPDDPDSWATKLDALPPLRTAAANGNARYGRLIVETTKWGYVERPDYCAVVYQIGDETPLRVVSAVPSTIIGMPKDALFVLGVETSTDKLAINGVQDRPVADTLVSYLMQGIFYAHEKAFGWIFGKFF